MNIVDAVLVFGLLNVAFEFILLCMVPPRMRLRMLGSEAKCNAIHVLCLVLNLWIHWGTLIGTMSGIFSFICSMFTVQMARLMFGTIVGTKYKRGLFGYTREELV
jgi:hypothetical protein